MMDSPLVSNQWIPVNVRLPTMPGHHPVIHSHTSLSGYTIHKQWYAYYDTDDGLWHDLSTWADMRWTKVVTHWLELPVFVE